VLRLGLATGHLKEIAPGCPYHEDIGIGAPMGITP